MFIVGGRDVRIAQIAEERRMWWDYVLLKFGPVVCVVVGIDPLAKEEFEVVVGF